jgi:hypothetical protein
MDGDRRPRVRTVARSVGPTGGGSAEQRWVHLERLAETTGRGWALSLRGAFLGEGRSTEGGWPGTKREARALLADSIAASTHDLAGASSDELERSVASLYAAARRHWLTR